MMMAPSRRMLAAIWILGKGLSGFLEVEGGNRFRGPLTG